MKYATTAFAAFAASPALAHGGLHIHPHADSSAWPLLMLLGLVIAGIGALAWRTFK